MGMARPRLKMENRIKPFSSRWRMYMPQFLFRFLKPTGMCRSFIRNGWKGWNPTKRRNPCILNTTWKNQLPTVMTSNGDQSDYKTCIRVDGPAALSQLCYATEFGGTNM